MLKVQTETIQSEDIVQFASVNR